MDKDSLKEKKSIYHWELGVLGSRQLAYACHVNNNASIILSIQKYSKYYLHGKE